MHLDWIKRVLCSAVAVGGLLAVPAASMAQGFNFDEDDSSDAAGFDFGDSSGGSVSTVTAEVDMSSTEYLKYTEAKALIDGKQYIPAAQILNEVISSNSDQASALSAQLHFSLGVALYETGYYQAALGHFDAVLNQGENTAEFDLTLPYLVMIGRALPGEPERYSRIYNKYNMKFPGQIAENLQSEVGYLLAMAAYRESKLDDVIFLDAYVKPDSEFYGRAHYLDGVTYVRQNKGQEALDSFKDVLRWLDEKAEQRELTVDEKRLREFTVAALGRVFYQVGSTLYKMGSKEKAASSWATSVKYYNAFNRNNSMWLESLFEASWAYYRVDNFGKALGLLLTLNSPFFNDKYYPEAMLLQAMIYYTNCHYDRVVDILGDYKATYEPLEDQVNKLVQRLFEPEEVYEFLHTVQNADRESFDPTLQQVLDAAVQDRDLLRGLAYIEMLDDEVKRINDNSQIAGTLLAQSMLQEIEIARSTSIISAGKKGKMRLERLQEELKDLSNRALDIEIETTEKYTSSAEYREEDPESMAQFDAEIKGILKADDEHLYWEFNGEYWNDELGYYWYYISSRCGR